MATDLRSTRRALLRWAAASLASGVGAAGAGASSGLGAAKANAPSRRSAAAPPGAVRLAAAWDDGAGHRAGILAWRGERVRVQAAIALPTRAHGLLAEPGGSLLAVSRRPGDWLLRCTPAGGAAQWAWAEPGRAFNGHAIRSADGCCLFTTETDLDSGAGLVGVRDLRSLAKTAEWPTHGIDPHALLLDAAGHLMIANGGVQTRPETGRTKWFAERMDSSLVRLDGRHGALLGQWRMPDRRLSLRHLAQGATTIGIALQAQHDDPQALAAAPVLAVFDGEQLVCVEPPRPLAGYAGDIGALAQGYALSCPRTDTVAVWQPGSGWDLGVAMTEAGAIASVRQGGQPERLWVAGRGEVQRLAPALAADRYGIGARLAIDNHWVAWPG